MELIGIYPVKRSVELKVETTALGIAVLGTPKLSEEELKVVAEIMCIELKHRKCELAKAVAKFEEM